jgi:hypothetical protein
LAPVRTDNSEERIAAVVKMTRIGELVTTLVVTSNRSTLVTVKVGLSTLILFTSKMKAVRSSETSNLKRAARRHNTEDGILHSHRRDNVKYYIALTGSVL